MFKAALALLGLLYVVGLLVMTFDLARSGLFIFDLARPLLLLPAGVVAAFLLVLTSFAYRTAERAFHLVTSFALLSVVFFAVS